MEPGVSIPILPARDLAETRAFYDRLGFQAAGWWPVEFGGYAILRRGDLSMLLFVRRHRTGPELRAVLLAGE